MPGMINALERHLFHMQRGSYTLEQSGKWLQQAGDLVVYEYRKLEEENAELRRLLREGNGHAFIGKG